MQLIVIIIYKYKFIGFNTCEKFTSKRLSQLGIFLGSRAMSLLFPTFNTIAIPSSIWLVTWQWNIQYPEQVLIYIKIIFQICNYRMFLYPMLPGLSALNLTMVKPLFGTEIESLAMEPSNFFKIFPFSFLNLISSKLILFPITSDDTR